MGTLKFSASAEPSNGLKAMGFTQDWFVVLRKKFLLLIRTNEDTFVALHFTTDSTLPNVMWEMSRQQVAADALSRKAWLGGLEAFLESDAPEPLKAKVLKAVRRRERELAKAAVAAKPMLDGMEKGIAEAKARAWKGEWFEAISVEDARFAEAVERVQAWITACRNSGRSGIFGLEGALMAPPFERRSTVAVEPYGMVDLYAKNYGNDRILRVCRMPLPMAEEIGLTELSVKEGD